MASHCRTTSYRCISARFLLAHQEQYAALVGVNSNGTLLFKIEAREDPDGVLRAYFKDKSLTDEDVQHYAAIFRAANPDAEVSVSEASGGDSYFNLVTPLHDAAGRLAAALIVELRADQMLTEAAGPHTTANATPQTQADAGWRKIIILNRQKNVLYSSNQAKQGKSLAEGFPTFEPTLSDILNGVYQVKDIYPISDNGRWMIRRFPYKRWPAAFDLRAGEIRRRRRRFGKSCAKYDLADVRAGECGHALALLSD